MPNSESLVPFGIGLIIVLGCCIVIPFFRGRSELLTAWNTLLLGIIVFSGLGALQVHYVSTLPYEQLNWFQPSVPEMQWFMWANAAFVATLLWAYYYNSWAISFAQRRLRKWPEVNTPVIFFVLGCCAVVMVGAILFGRLPIIGPVLGNWTIIVTPAAPVFTFILWYRNPRNLIWLGLFIGVFMCAAMYSMIVFGGRRLLLSVFLGPFLYAYWIHIRYWGRSKLILATGAAAVAIFGISVVYSKFRYFDQTTGERRNVSSIAGQIHGLRGRGDLLAPLLRAPLEYFAQSTGHFSLLSQHYVAIGAVKPIPLNSLRFLAAYPIPRDLWPEKPDPFGLTIPRDVARVGKGNNWGLGIAGYMACEGGIAAGMLYAVLLAFGVRFMDEPLKLQPSNPFLICMLASAIPHLVAIPRGDMGTMTMQVGHCVLFVILLGFACRAIFGVQKSPLPRWLPVDNSQYGSYRALNTPRTNQ